jgi:alpha-tubulin suppressor-like RCC1 family protein
MSNSGRVRVLVVALVMLVAMLPAWRAQAGAIETIASGNGTSCVIFGNGNMWCWGRNDAGQLADGTTTDRPNPIFVAGTVHLAALADRNVCRWTFGGSGPGYGCAGANEFGQIGDGTTIERHAFTAPSTFMNLNLAIRTFTAGDTALHQRER